MWINVNAISIFIFITIAFAEKIADLSFEPPFETIDRVGVKTVSRQWRAHGDATVQTNFARIAPDRQSQLGALWSRHSTASQVLSVILTFRISGKSKQFYGDGLAFWLVTQGYHTQGDLHGFTDKFTGIGIIFDTFKNTDSGLVHRDVTVLVNDGEKTLEMMDKDGYGCDINVRYDTSAGDFNVQKSLSRMKFLVNMNSIDIFIDARNTGEWERCVKIDDLALPPGWLPHSHIGLTATTGQLADNHDVISLLTYSEAQAMEREMSEKMSQKLFPMMINGSTEERLERYILCLFVYMYAMLCCSIY